MKKKTLRTVTVFICAGLSGGLLLYTSQNVQQAESRLSSVEATLRQEQDSIRVLNAEWAYLNSPERLEELSNKYLDLKAAQPGNIMTSPSALPAPVKLDEAEGMIHEIAQEAPSAPAPQKPPVMVAPEPEIKAPAREKADFNDLLNRLSSGGTR
jgi:hypothetical protein